MDIFNEASLGGDTLLFSTHISPRVEIRSRYRTIRTKEKEMHPSRENQKQEEKLKIKRRLSVVNFERELHLCIVVYDLQLVADDAE